MWSQAEGRNQKAVQSQQSKWAKIQAGSKHNGSKQNRERNPQSEVNVHKAVQTGKLGSESATKNGLHTLQSGTELKTDWYLNKADNEG